MSDKSNPTVQAAYIHVQPFVWLLLLRIKDPVLNRVTVPRANQSVDDYAVSREFARGEARSATC